MNTPGALRNIERLYARMRYMTLCLYLAIAATAPAMSAQAGSTADLAHGKALFGSQCALCHGPAGEGGQGPALIGVVGRKVASAQFSYTAALRERSWTWDGARLDQFLAAPQDTVPGTSMSARVTAADDRADLIAYLGALESTATSVAAAQSTSSVFGGWEKDAPGQVHHITQYDLPPPSLNASATNPPKIVARPADAWPKAPPDFKVSLFAKGLTNPRIIRAAPNGDIFVAETAIGQVTVLRPTADGSAVRTKMTFATRLDEPFGLAFYPNSAHPRWLYVAETNRVVRYDYTLGAMKALGPPHVVIASIAGTHEGHSNRDLAISVDGRWMYVGVGSASNVAEGMKKRSLADAQAFEREHGLGAAWDDEEDRAQVLAFTPDGKERRAYATGIRNCAGIAIQPSSGEVWCSTNERDRLGDDLVPDYVTTVKPGAFYGWPWWYIGDHEDPRLPDRPDLRGRVTIPDVLLQAHSASLGISFADGARLPAQWRGSAFAAEHGSWNRADRTGSKLIRIPVNPDGTPTGAYEDVMTGFVLDNEQVWGRLVAVTPARDGSLLISDDGTAVIWRLTYTGP